MLHFETGHYGDEPFFWQDSADIREKMQSLTENIDAARRELSGLQELREELISVAGEGVYDEDSAAYRLLSELEGDMEDAEASITAMQADLSAFKEELADTLYLMRGRGLA